MFAVDVNLCAGDQDDAALQSVIAQVVAVADSIMVGDADRIETQKMSFVNELNGAMLDGLLGVIGRMRMEIYFQKFRGHHSNNLKRGSSISIVVVGMYVCQLSVENQRLYRHTMASFIGLRVGAKALIA